MTSSVDYVTNASGCLDELVRVKQAFRSAGIRAHIVEADHDDQPSHVYSLRSIPGFYGAPAVAVEVRTGRPLRFSGKPELVERVVAALNDQEAA